MTGYNNRKMGRVVKVALALLVLFGTSQSYATCSQGNLKGTWYFNGVSGDTFFGTMDESDFCKITVNSVGKVKNAGSQCQFRTSDGKDSVNDIGGNLVINSGCAITGKIKFCEGEICANLVMDAARMDKGKTVITLVGRLSIDPDIVIFMTGVKR